jgi:predicted RecB family nuclease
MEPIITSEVVVAYSQCPRKAYLLMFSPDKSKPHEYVKILEQERRENQRRYIDRLKEKSGDVQPYTADSLHKGHDFLVNAHLQVDGFEAECSFLTKVDEKSALGKYSYEPTICVGTHTISREQKLEISFVGYVLERLQNKQPMVGTIIGMNGSSHGVKLDNNSKDLWQILEPLKEWMVADSPEQPPIILNKHCSLCQFQQPCQFQAEKEDNLSLLDNISTMKIIKKYERKGIFTVNQLSYLYRPRKQKKRSRKSLAPKHDVTLQALVIRTGKIFVLETPLISRNSTEIFLDIEGIPDQQFYYLVGLLICDKHDSVYHALWANTLSNELQMWNDFLNIINKYPNSSIYHYGSYELKAISKLGHRYKTDITSIKNRLVNINTYIYGKVYFPLRSNRLKEIGKYIGASWESDNASGLLSLVWRHSWEKTGDMRYRQYLTKYNEDDCRALALLTETLSDIQEREDFISDIDYYIHTKKSRSSKVDNPLHDQLETILKFAHSNYSKNKIQFRKEEQNEGIKGIKIHKRGGYNHRKKRHKPTRIIQTSHLTQCPRCGCKVVSPSKRSTERFSVDLIFTKNGVRKSIAKYWAYMGRCPQCQRSFSSYSPDVGGRSQFLGSGIKIWLVYLRIALRIPYHTINMIVQDMFDEDISDAMTIQCIKEVANYHFTTEQLIFNHILQSPFIHADETMINIDNVNQYVWVFTDGKHVIFKHTATREADFLHEFLDDYKGILISDFFPGYDSLACKQQKCLVHIIRDLNNDLWSSPFDTEYELFVAEVKNLLVPIMETVQRYGLKKRHLRKFMKSVDKFYAEVIDGRHYKSELCLKYQQRFLKYRKPLFTFLEQDGIPWHNNTAESAIRHLPLQQRISGIFHTSVINQYLTLLGVRQTCRFQGKSFLKFLLSGEQDIDRFKSSKNSKKRSIDDLEPSWKKALGRQ